MQHAQIQGWIDRLKVYEVHRTCFAWISVHLGSLCDIISDWSIGRHAIVIVLCFNKPSRILNAFHYLDIMSHVGWKH